MAQIDDITKISSKDRSGLCQLSDVRSNFDYDQKGDATEAVFLRAGLEIYSDWQTAYDHFNAALWNNALPDAIITRTRKKSVLGFFAPDRFRHVDGRIVAEISMNSSYLAVNDNRDSLSTLVHEMAHVWRHYLGPLNRNGLRVTNGYHDLKWAAEMERVGLIASNTGAPGGKKTGYRMTHYIEQNGAFDVACAALLDSGFKINWADRIIRSKMETVDPDDPDDPDATPQKKDRIKFSCPSCGLNAWAKPTAKLACATCSLHLSPAPLKGSTNV
jgi:hypothetical protein